MKDKEILKQSYRKIVKEKQSHQQAFDAIIAETDKAPDKVANMISAIPSTHKQSQFSALRYFYIGLLFFIFGLRLFAVIELTSYTDISVIVIIIGSLFSIVAPREGIYAALMSKERFYRSAAILFGIA